MSALFLKINKNDAFFSLDKNEVLVIAQSGSGHRRMGKKRDCGY